MAEEIYVLKVGGVNARGNYAEMDHHIKVDNLSGDFAWQVATELLQYYNTTCLPKLQPLLGSDVRVDVLTCRREDPVGAITANLVTNASGSSSDPTVSMGVAVNVQLINPSINRPGHAYLFGVYVSAVIQDVIDSAVYIPNVGLYFATLTVPFVTSGGDQARLAMYNKQTLTWADVTNISVQSRVTAMGRRTRPVV